MIKQIKALQTRWDTETFFTHGESNWIDGGIIGSILQADRTVMSKGANASAKAVSNDSSQEGQEAQDSRQSAGRDG